MIEQMCKNIILFCFSENITSHVIYSSSQTSPLVFLLPEENQLMHPGPEDIAKGFSSKNKFSRLCMFILQGGLASVLIVH